MKEHGVEVTTLGKPRSIRTSSDVVHGICRGLPSGGNESVYKQLAPKYSDSTLSVGIIHLFFSFIIYSMRCNSLQYDVLTPYLMTFF